MRLDNQLVVETPERVELRFALASVGSRFLAAFIDHSLQLVAVFLWFLVVAQANEWLHSLKLKFGSQAELWLLAVTVLVIFVISAGYFTVFETWWNGQTPGKRCLRLRVIRIDGRPIGFFEAWVRNTLRVIDFLPSSYALGVMTMMLHPESRRLGDLVAGTVVVKERIGATPGLDHVLARHAAAVELRAQAPPVVDLARLQALTPDEVTAVERFLFRRAALPEQLRPWMAARIANTVSRRLGLPHPPDAEAFLEAIDRQYRAQAKYLVD